MDNNNRSIMVIDDDDDDRRLFCEMLRDVNEQVTCLRAPNGQDALSYLQDPSSKKPDVIFLDINMPIMNGWEFLTKVKKVPELGKIPIVMFSTSANQRDVDIAYDLGATSYCVKPDEPKVLRDMLRFVADNISGFATRIGHVIGNQFFVSPTIR